MTTQPQSDLQRHASAGWSVYLDWLNKE